MSDSADWMPDLIRVLRKDCSMTQVEFAAALGVAPASVHRWEAGASNPDFELVVALWSLAIEHGSATSKQFEDFLANRVEAIRPLFKASRAPLVEALDSEIASLSPDQHQLAQAFVRMLKNNKDHTADQVMRLLLEPWKQKPADEKSSCGASRESRARPPRRQPGRRDTAN